MAPTTRPVAPADLQAAVLQQTGYAASLFDELRAGSQAEAGVTRAAYGEGEEFAHTLVARRAEALGLEVTRDYAANTYMRWPGRDPSAPAVIIGSHLDSVPQGGNYDGAAGVAAGLVAIAALKQLGMTPRCDLIVMGVRAEESIWFRVSYIGSRSALGSLPAGALEARRVDSQRSLGEHIADLGGNPAAIRAGARHLNPAQVRAFLELHIEQAPSLVAEGRPVAICTGIPGNFRFPEARITGVQGHVGQPRRFRRDAAIAASDFAVALDAVWEEHEAAGTPMAFTLGQFGTDPAQHGLTIVPGRFDFSLDVRAYDDAVLEGLERKIASIITQIEQRRGVTFDLGRRTAAEVGRMDPQLQVALKEGADELGIPWMPLGSPASHDAAAFAAADVPSAMIFVRNRNGSHNPDEAMEISDFLAGAAVLTSWLASNACMREEPRD
ncbi:Zn-dependent hydrolase [Roseomonas terrae]|uniref:Zn-dependent hydrolase n=1 Tax=Neoroseomonas terrae TaxID=424799 RepID=A0ABS5EC83_9PROT|nr:Zn-dependent hydrolase [Neoroseomonas terrae]MBR0648624.1 Zn-dependent hydrolase [Neoroseomonas terrae]